MRGVVTHELMVDRWCLTSGLQQVFAWLHPALLISAVSVAICCAVPPGGPACPRAHREPSSSDSPAAVCDGGSYGGLACCAGPSAPDQTLRPEQKHKSQTEYTFICQNENREI